MDPVERIRTTFERSVKALTLRPAMGQGTAVTKVRVRDGMTCDIEDGRWSLVADLSEKSGGTGAGPDPGVLGRAALGSCLAMSYAKWAAARGVPISGVEVEIQADYDARGEYGIEDVSPGYLEVRYVVTVESAAPEEEILSLLDEADTYTPWLDVFARPQELRRDVRVVAPRS